MKAKLIALGIIALWVLALVFACSPGKKVIEANKDFESIGREWAKTHPCVNDTMFLKGGTDTIVKIDTYIDSFPVMYFDTTTKVMYKTLTKVVTKTNTLRDTLIKVVVDNRIVQAVRDELNKAKDETIKAQQQAANSEAKAVSARKAANKWMVLFWLLILLGGIAGYLFKKLNTKR